MKALTSTSRAVRGLGLVLLAVVALAGAGCGGGDDAGAPPAAEAAPATTERPAVTTATTPAPAGADAVAIVSFKYAPDAITVKTGSKVEFANEDAAAHTVTDDGGAFDSGTLDRADAKKVTFSEAGTFAYHCAFHPFMHGKVVVEP